MTVLGDITLRSNVLGVDLAFEARAEPDTWPSGNTRTVLLIHGFNVNQCAACLNYEHFMHRLPAGFPDITRVFWPGDERTPLYSAVTYFNKIPIAELAAERLWTYILGRFSATGNPRIIDIIAHSLGCRLTVKLLDCVSKTPPQDRPDVRLVSLMAAAVPVEYMERSRATVPHYRDAAQDIPKDMVVLHSRDDLVLAWAFPAGQAMASAFGIEPQRFDEAIGRYGRPDDLTAYSHPVDGAGHGDYWKHRDAIRRTSPRIGLAPRHWDLPRHRGLFWRLATPPEPIRYSLPRHPGLSREPSLCHGCDRADARELI